MPLADVGDPDGVLPDAAVYGFDLAYQEASVIERNRGYWILADRAGTLNLDCAELGTQALDVQTLRTSGAVGDADRLVVADANGASQTLYLGTAAQSATAYRLPPLPPQGGFDARFDGDTRLMAGEQGQVRVQTGAAPVRLALYGRKAHVYRIEEVQGGQVVAVRTLRAGDQVTLQVRTEALNVRRQDVASLPDDVNLRGPSPNPFRGVASLHLSLPDDAQVELRVFDLLGRQVLQTRRTMTAGESQPLQLDGSNLPSGVYFYRVSAAIDESVVVRTGRMTIVR
jgi:hypothetical protein